MKALPVMLVAALALSACTTAPGYRVRSAREVPHQVKHCIAKSWLQDGELSHEQYVYLTQEGLDKYRKRYGSNPKIGPPDLARIQHRCQ